MDEEMRGRDFEGGTGAVKNPGEAGTQGASTHPTGPAPDEEEGEEE